MDVRFDAVVGGGVQGRLSEKGEAKESTGYIVLREH